MPFFKCVVIGIWIMACGLLVTPMHAYTFPLFILRWNTMDLSRTYVRVLIICIIIVLFGTILVMKRRAEITIDTQPTKIQIHQVDRFDHDMLKKNDKTETCEARNLSFITDTNPNRTQIALVSFPGSGNTWVRHLIQELTGYYTGSVYRDSDLAAHGFLGEYASIEDHNKQCIVYKTHGPKIYMFKKAVIIIRHPLHAIKAFFNFQYGKRNSPKGRKQKVSKTGEIKKRATHTGSVSLSMFNSSKFTYYLERKLTIWKNRNVGWLKKFESKCLVVLYENLKNNLSFELKRIARFLGVKVQPKDVRCTVENSEGNFHRKKKSDIDLLSILNEKQIRMINEAVYELSDVSKRLNLYVDTSQYLISS